MSRRAFPPSPAAAAVAPLLLFLLLLLMVSLSVSADEGGPCDGAQCSRGGTPAVSGDTCICCPNSGCYPATKPCMDATKGCQECDVRGNCLNCVNATHTIVNGTCQGCVVDGCRYCFLNDETSCNVCNNNLYWFNDTRCGATASSLSNCAVGHCDLCAVGEEGVCNRCMPFFAVQRDGTCVSDCVAPNCRVCYPGLREKCMTCESGYFYNKAATPPGCVEAAAHPGPDKLRCRQANCEECDASSINFGRCEKCDMGYQELDVDGSCRNCLVPGCTACSATDHHRCTTCSPEYVLNAATGVCERPACYVANCRTCDTNNPNRCMQCYDGYTYDPAENVCNRNREEPPSRCTVPNCLECAAGTTNICASCQGGYTLTNGACVPTNTRCRVYYCRTCQPNNAVRCQACYAGYGITTAGTCVRVRYVSRNGASVPANLLAAVAVAAASLALAVV